MVISVIGIALGLYGVFMAIKCVEKGLGNARLLVALNVTFLVFNAILLGRWLPW